MTKTTYAPHVQYLMSHGKLKHIGKPCRRNPDHVGLRYIAGHDCVECGVYDTWDIEAEQKFGWVAEGITRDAFTAEFDELVVLPPPFDDARRNRSAAKDAFKEGKSYFQGSPCGQCGCTLRFSSTTGCVACQRLQSATADESGSIIFRNSSQALEFVGGTFVPILTMRVDRMARQVAIALGLSLYAGSPCKQCAGNTRYTSRGQCICCVKHRNISKKKTAPAQTGAAKGDFDHLFE